MADKDDTTTEEVTPAEVTEDDLRNLIGEEIDKRISGLSEGISGLADSILEKLKGEGSSDDSLLEKIGGMIDEKLKGVSSGGSGDKGNGKSTTERVPKIRIFS